MRGCFLFIAFIFFSCKNASAQSITDISLLLEDYFQKEEKIANENDQFVLEEELAELIESPVNINMANQQELEKLFFLTDFQILSLLEYRKNYGYFVSKHELQYVYGFDEQLTEKISPLISISAPDGQGLKKSKRIYDKNNLLIGYSSILEEQEGYKLKSDSLNNNHFLGSPGKIIFKYNYGTQKYRFGIVGEKDPGEEFFKGTNKHGFDFYSGFFELDQYKGFEKIIIGDYSLSFGQGLNVNQGFNSGTRLGTNNLRLRNNGIRRYYSLNENKFMRGAALTYRWRAIYFTPFCSRKKVDASYIYNTADSGNVLFKSFVSSGIHATNNELAKEKSLSEEIGGFNLLYNSTILKAGINYHRVKYGGAFIQKDLPYNMFHSISPVSHFCSFEYQLLLRQFIFFGESALEAGKGYAHLMGLILNMGGGNRLAFLWRDYQEEFNNVNASTFGKSGRINNEKGFYFGMDLNVFSNMVFTLGLDHYKFPWLRHGIDGPTYGNELKMSLRYQPLEVLRIAGTFKIDDNETGKLMEAEKLQSLLETNKYSLKLVLEFEVNEELRIKNLVQSNIYRDENDEISRGIFIYQDIRYYLSKITTQLYLRYALFDTDDFMSRIYVYENNLPASYSFKMFQDSGNKFYLMAKKRIAEKTDIWMKYSRQIIKDARSIGSGLNTISGQTRSEIQLAVNLQF